MWSCSSVAFATVKNKGVMVFETTSIPGAFCVDFKLEPRGSKSKKKKTKEMWMGDKHGFLGSMATRFPWFEVVCGKDGKMKMIIGVP